MPDVVANIALFLGIVHFLAASDPSPEKAIDFVDAKKSFYSAARYGLGAQVKWLDGNNHNIQQLLSDIILGTGSFGWDRWLEKLISQGSQMF